VTKGFTGTALILLVAQQKIDLDGPINDYLPSARHQSPMCCREIELELYLRHGVFAGAATSKAHSTPILGDSHEGQNPAERSVDLG
jgi:CubicO group peptidase (beta-lactamase class C family)